MRIGIRVKPGSKNESVEKTADGGYIVRVKAPAREGRANEAVIAALGRHFGVPKSRISIVRGLSGRDKMVDIA